MEQMMKTARRIFARTAGSPMTGGDGFLRGVSHVQVGCDHARTRDGKVVEGFEASAPGFEPFGFRRRVDGIH